MQSFESLQYRDKASIIIVDNDSTIESKNALEEIIEKSEIDIGVPMQIRISTEIIENIPIDLSLKEIGFISK